MRVDEEEDQVITRDSIYASPGIAALVERYHTWPTITRQSTGEHSARVANIYVEIFGLPRAEVLYYCLNHDNGELWGGDLPFTAKDANPGMREASNLAEKEGLRRLDIEMPSLTADEFERVKIADLLEMWEHGWHEYRLGNQYAVPIVSDTYEAALGRAEKSMNLRATTEWCHKQCRRMKCQTRI
jgi:5'-deoxynucleotidase YfbR-like HD superfamily hydrolase